MSETRKEIKEFESKVRVWLLAQKVNIENLIIESHTSVDGYIICWNKYNHEHVVYNMDEWSKYLSERYKDIREADLQTLKNM